MQLARAEGSQLRRDITVDLRPILQIVVAEHESGDKVGRIVLDLPDQAVLSDLDPDALAIIARNLIDNALRHGDPHRPVAVTLTPNGILRVANDGPLIPPEILAGLADRFTRVGDGTEGSGLGLAIVAKAAERIGSRLVLVSPRPGSTSGFSAELSL